ncbi:MAG TPA: mechanosensitive ion channel [Tepidisphaeraceae bacterium]|jgi:small conductance mechanosensitive channel
MIKKLIVLLIVMVGVGAAYGQAAFMGSATENKSATTKPAEPASQANGPQTFAQVFANTRLAKLAQGQQVSLEDLRDPAFWIDTIRDLIIAMVGFVPRIMVALLFLLVFWAIYRAVRRIIVGSMKKANVDPSIREMLGHLVKWSIMGFGIVIACNQIGIQIAALLTGVSIIGLAIGFAAQETLANFIAGVVIFWDKPFRVGDWIEIDGVFGQVQRVTFRSTRVLSLNGEAVVFPNTHMLSTKVSNHSTHPLTRVTVAIGIAYKESIDDARQVLLRLAAGDTRVASDPKPQVVVDACADSAVNLLLRFWIVDESIEFAMRHEYLEKAKNALDEAGITIPFPHMQILMERKAEEAELRKAG